MAGKKGGAAPLQIDVSSDEDWDALLNKDGLLVIDAYADWCGPCSGMAGNLKKIKVEIGGDRLILATARTERIAALDRFRGRSEPAWLLVSKGQLLAVLLGADPPRLAREVTKHLRHLTKVSAGEEPLASIPWDKLTAEEEERLAAAEARRKRAEMLERARQEAERRKKRADELAPFAEPLIRHTVVVFLPPVVKDGRASKVVEGLRSKWRSLRLRVRQQGKILINAEMGAELFWQRKLPQHEQVIECLQSGPSLVLLVERQPPPKPVPVPKPLPEEVPVTSSEEEGVPADSVGPDGEAPPNCVTPETPGGQGGGPSGGDDSQPPPECAPGAAAPPPDDQQEAKEEEEEEEDVESVVARLLYGFVPVMPPDDIEETNVPPTAADICYGWVGTGTGSMTATTGSAAAGKVAEDVLADDAADTTEDEAIPLLQPAVDSAASALLIRRDQNEPSTSPVLPGLWTPLTTLSKVVAVRVLYPSVADRLFTMAGLDPSTLSTGITDSGATAGGGVSGGAGPGATGSAALPLPPVVVLLFEADAVGAVDAALAAAAGAAPGSPAPEEMCEDVVKRAWTDASTSPAGEQRLALAIAADAAETIAALRAASPVYVSGDADTGAVDINFYFLPDNESTADGAVTPGGGPV